MKLSLREKQRSSGRAASDRAKFGKIGNDDFDQN
jgi:hypothetical protein